MEASTGSQMNRVGRYHLVERLAVGGMAEVFLACERGTHALDRLLVIKRILPHLAENEVFVQMFMSEARLAARINHPNVVQIYELGESGGYPFIAMEYVSGSSLKELISAARAAGTRLPVGAVVHLMAQACAGTHAAHELKAPNGQLLNLVHRDLSPHNLMVTDQGHVKLLDFGIAKAEQGMDTTRTGMLKGKVSYMSPEQCKQQKLDRRSDTYALGFVLWEMLAGRKMFHGMSELATMQAIVTGQLKDLREVRRDVPHPVLAVLQKALTNPLEQRYQTADDMRRDLLAAAEASGMDVDPDKTARLVRTLLGKEELPLLVVASLRPRANPAADGFASGEDLSVEPQEILVGPLVREDIVTIVYGLVGESLQARLLAHRLHKETEGNAYFITEFLRSLMAKKVIVKQGDAYRLTAPPEEITTGHLEIPLGVRQMMKSRLDEVSKEDRAVLEVLAVASRPLDLDVLLDVLDEADEEDVLDALDRLLTSGIVRERRAGELVTHAVTHQKFADVVYRDLDPERRANLHRRMAAALELHYANDSGAMEIVGEHYRKAGDAGRAYRYLVAAARRLAERSLAQEAWDLTEKAGTLEHMAMADLPPDDFRIYRRDNLNVRAQVHYNRAEWGDAEKAYRAVLNLSEEEGDASMSTVARLRLATVLRRQGDYENSQAFAEQALEAARRLHFREGVAEALHCMAALAWADGRLDACEQLANEGLMIAQGGRLAEQRASLLLALTAAQATRGSLASATTG
ncbi:MAG: protein kinase, partial [Myxococcales bacterium]|nr:protein kinase [Myxococcales bacterium]